MLKQKLYLKAVTMQVSINFPLPDPSAEDVEMTVEDVVEMMRRMVGVPVGRCIPVGGQTYVCPRVHGITRGEVV